MKRTTKKEREIIAIDATIKPIPRKAVTWGLHNIAYRAAYSTYRRETHFYCMECGHDWEWKGSKMALEYKAMTYQQNFIICPRCHQRLRMFKTNEAHHKDTELFTVMEAADKYQLYRVVAIESEHNRRQRAKRRVQEVCRIYFDPETRETVTIARGIYYCLRSYEAHFVLDTPLELRHFNDSTLNSIPPTLYPDKQLAHGLIKRGLTPHCPDDLLGLPFVSELTASSLLETVVKMGNYDDAYWFYLHQYRADQVWPSYKIAQRQGYIIDDLDDWVDYLEMLEDEGKDIRNPHYICPTDLAEAHQELLMQRQLREEREAEEEERIKALDLEERELAYKQHKGQFIGLTFGDDLITCHVLGSVEEFQEEAEQMDHCVYACHYDLKPDSLILSATINGQRIETVEYSLSQHIVMQSRGIHNCHTEYHDRIVNLVEANTPAIMARQV